ncbi:MAG TPA: hypothetical protein VJ843_00430 [Candidatus Saccharimonadales bacterium]|nr:hypothetical protein [Candidatus Saccharimonadales bacterium]
MVEEDLTERQQKGRALTISLTSRILLSLSAGCLITGAMGFLFILALLKVNNQGGSGWERLLDVVSKLWTPAAYCCAKLRPAGLEDMRAELGLTAFYNVMIYSLAVLLISGIYDKWVKR